MYLRALILTLMTVAAATAQTWNVGTASWNTAGSWSPSGVPASATTTQLVFNATGTTSYTATNNIGAGTFTLNKMTFGNTGTGTITIAGAAANTLSMSGTTPTLDVTGRVSFTALFAAGAGSITKVGNGTFIHDSNNTAFVGTLNVNAGTFINDATIVATTNFNPVSIVVNNGGTYQFGVNTAGNPNLPATTFITVNSGGTVIWQEGENLGGFNLQGGLIDLQQGSTTAASATAVQSWTAGTLTGTGVNTFSAADGIINKSTTGTVIVSGNAILAPATLNIEQGIISFANAVNLGSGNVTLGTASTAGVFRYTGLSATRPTGTFATATGSSSDIVVSNASTILTLGGGTTGTGRINIDGLGTVHITGALASTGDTVVEQGTLRVNPVTASGRFRTFFSSVLATNSGTGSASFTLPQLDLNDTSALLFELNTAAVTTAPLVVVSAANGLTSSGTPILRLTNLQSFANGTYTLIDYNGTAITSGYMLQAPGRTAAALNYNTAATTIEAIISGTDTVKWTGAINSTWDIGTAPNVGGTNNWQTVIGGNATNFIQTDTITFDDSATNFTVNLTATVLPAAVTVNNSVAYTLSGSGLISGATALSKVGIAIFTLATDNDYTGGTSITGGTLQLGNGGATGSIFGPISINGGSLAYNRTAALTVANAFTIAGSAAFVQNGSGAITISSALTLGTNALSLAGNGAAPVTLAGLITGSGAITKSGTSTFTVTSASTGFTGTVAIDGGTFQLDANGGSGDLNPTEITINTGGKFIFGPTANPDLPGTSFVNINGGTFESQTGESFGALRLGGGGALVVFANAGAWANPGPNDTGTVLESGTIATSGSATGRALIDGNATFPIRKTTVGTVTITGSFGFDTNTPLFIDEGVIEMLGFNVPSDTPATPITFGTATTTGTLRITDAATPAATIPRATSLVGNATIDIADAGGRLNYSGIISGAGNLTKSGSGTLTLSGVNTYTGTTSISGGRLNLNADNTAATGAISVASTTVLGGTGTLGGTVTVDAGGTLRGGASVGTLTVNGVAFASGAFIGVELAATGSPAAITTGGSTLGTLPNPTNNSYLRKTGGLLTGLENVNISVDLGNLVFSNTAYSYQVGEGFGDQSTLSIIADNRFNFINGNVEPGLSSLTGTSSGAIFLNFTPVPEPMWLLAFAGLALGIRRRV